MAGTWLAWLQLCVVLPVEFWLGFILQRASHCTVAQEPLATPEPWCAKKAHFCCISGAAEASGDGCGFSHYATAQGLLASPELQHAKKLLRGSVTSTSRAA